MVLLNFVKLILPFEYYVIKGFVLVNLLSNSKPLCIHDLQTFKLFMISKYFEE
jgi:hypothetical protein